MCIIYLYKYINLCFINYYIYTNLKVTIKTVPIESQCNIDIECLNI